MLVILPVREKFPVRPILLFNNVFLVAGCIIYLAVRSLRTGPRSFGVIELLAIPSVLGAAWLLLRFGWRIFKSPDEEGGFLSPVGHRAGTMFLTGLVALGAGVFLGFEVELEDLSHPPSNQRTATKHSESGIVDSRPLPGTTQSHGKIYIAPPLVAATTPKPATTTTNLTPSHP